MAANRNALLRSLVLEHLAQTVERDYEGDGFWEVVAEALGCHTHDIPEPRRQEAIRLCDTTAAALRALAKKG